MLKMVLILNIFVETLCTTLPKFITSDVCASRSLCSASERRFIVWFQRGKKSLSQTFKLNVPCWWNDLPNSIRAFILLQESAKNTSLPSLYDPLTLALFIIIVFFKKHFLDLHSIHLLTACFLKKTNTNTSLLYSFSIWSVFFLLYNKKKTWYVHCVKLTETCIMLFCWFWLLPLSSFVSRFG